MAFFRKGEVGSGSGSRARTSARSGSGSKREALLATAIEQRQADPANADSWIWVGRRQAYLGRYGAAIETYMHISISAFGPLFFMRPISLAIFALLVLGIVWPILKRWRRRPLDDND